MKFNIGDRVRYVGKEIGVETIGVVQAMSGPLYGVRFEGWTEGHGLWRGNQATDSWWCWSAELEAAGPLAPVGEATSGMRLPSDSAERKKIPIVGGVLNYFPDAIIAVARISQKGNDKHNPGQPLHWSRDKSTDHIECIARHLVDYDKLDEDGEYHIDHLIWRACALSQLMKEANGAPKAPGAK